MRGEDNWEEAQWLGGEAQVYPGLGSPKPTSLKRFLSGLMFLVTGVGIGRLAMIDAKPQGEIRQKGSVAQHERQAPTERSETMGRRRDEDEGAERGSVDELGVVTIVAAFGVGLVAGAVTALLTTPESGASVRGRVKRGVNTAKREFDETVNEVKEDWSTVGDGIYDSVKRTASRVKHAAEVTKEALTEGDGNGAPVRRVP